jgi:hypothetical protein
MSDELLAHQLILASADASDIEPPRAQDRVRAMYEAIRVGVAIEQAVVGSGLSLGEFADLCEARPEVPAAIVRARLDLRVRLQNARLAAAEMGKHKAAEAMLEELPPVDQELAEVIVNARAADVGELSAAQVEAQLDGMFTEE